MHRNFVVLVLVAVVVELCLLIITLNSLFVTEVMIKKQAILSNTSSSKAKILFCMLLPVSIHMGCLLASLCNLRSRETFCSKSKTCRDAGFEIFQTYF
jgi:hypothetical protein